MDSNKVFGQSGKVGESDKLNIDSIIARLLEGNTLLSLRLSSRMDCGVLVLVLLVISSELSGVICKPNPISDQVYNMAQ